MIINLRKNTSKIIKIFVLLLIIFSITLINANNKGEETILTSAQGLSSKKIGWGIKRNDNHEQPDLGKANKEILEKNNVTATFFITAHYLNTQPELIKQMIDEGHIVGNQFPYLLMEL